MLKMSTKQSTPLEQILVDYSEEYDVVFVRAQGEQLIFDPTKQTPRRISEQINHKWPQNTSLGLHRTYDAASKAHLWQQSKWWIKQETELEKGKRMLLLIALTNDSDFLVIGSAMSNSALLQDKRCKEDPGKYVKKNGTAMQFPRQKLRCHYNSPKTYAR